MGVNVDDRDFQLKIKKYNDGVSERIKKSVFAVASEVLRLSQVEVPHDTGMLQNSGHLDPEKPADDIIVGYNKVYAAKMHEHPEYHFKNGRKGKYLEDPIKMNLSVFRNYFKEALNIK